MKRRFRKLVKHSKAAPKYGGEHIRKRPYIVPVLGLFLGFSIVGAVLLGHGELTLKPSEAHVVFLFDYGRRRVLNTKTKTVGELISRLPLNLIPEDVVEPALDSPIPEDNFRINIYRARPVTVIDNNADKLVTLTAQQSPRVVAQNAGLVVFPEDRISFAQGSLKENVIGEKVVIERATAVAINLYGTPTTTHTFAKTVAQLLEEKNIKPAPGDSVQPTPETLVTPNLQVAVIRHGTQVATVEEAIAPPEQIVEDASLSFGTTVVRQAGASGKKIVTYQINTQNNQEVSRTVLQEAIITAPVPEIVARGKTVSITGDKTSLMNAAGIAGSDHGYVNFIISRESNWRPDARNAGGCLGLGQACPGSKLTAVCPNLDPVCQLKFFGGYAQGRYGGWGGAYSFWQRNHYW